MDALITYGGDRVGYSAMRSLAGLGLDVAVADTGRVGLSQFSRFCSKSYVLSHGFRDQEAFVGEVSGILKDCGARFLLPTQNDTPVLARYRELLPEGVILPVARYEKVRAANDKAVTAALAKETGVGVPEVIEWKDTGELEERLKGITGRLVVKLREGYSARWVYYPSDSGEAVEMCKGLIKQYRLGPDSLPIVQRWVKGEKWMVSCLYFEGKRIASFTHKTLRETPVTGGVSTLRVSLRNSLLESYAERMLDSLGWHGIAMVEFKQSSETGEGWFIEINPRLWGSLCNAPAAGVDMVALLYIASTEGPDKALGMVRPQRDGVVSRAWTGDASLAFSEARRLRFGRALRLLMPGGTDVYDEFRRDDPGVAAGALARPVARYIKSLMTRERGAEGPQPA